MLTTATTARVCPGMSIAEGGARSLAVKTPHAGTVAIAWLGQAGFLVRTASHTILIDPYLSDFLAKKYRGREFPHERLVPAPLAVAEIGRLDFVLCTHRHSDHMDPETLLQVAARHPVCRFMIPAADVEHARGLGLPADRLVPIDAGETRSLAASVSVTAVPAAHETLDYDPAGRCRFLGYVLRLPGLALYHSGDTVVYPDLPATLSRLGIDCAILPVNGRDEFRSTRGVPGNMSAAEAIALCHTAGIPLLMPCHFGMFAFNTATASDVALIRECATPRTLVPDLDHHFVLTPVHPSQESQ